MSTHRLPPAPGWLAATLSNDTEKESSPCLEARPLACCCPAQGRLCSASPWWLVWLKGKVLTRLLDSLSSASPCCSPWRSGYSKSASLSSASILALCPAPARARLSSSSGGHLMAGGCCVPEGRGRCDGHSGGLHLMCRRGVESAVEKLPREPLQPLQRCRLQTLVVPTTNNKHPRLHCCGQDCVRTQLTIIIIIY